MFGGESQDDPIAEKQIRNFFSAYSFKPLYQSPIVDKMSWFSPVEKVKWFEDIQEPWIIFIDGMENIKVDKWKFRLDRIFKVARKARLSLTIILAGTTEWKATMTPYLAEKIGELEVFLDEK